MIEPNANQTATREFTRHPNAEASASIQKLRNQSRPDWGDNSLTIKKHISKLNRVVLWFDMKKSPPKVSSGGF
jgi:hypothetical protein